MSISVAVSSLSASTYIKSVYHSQFYLTRARKCASELDYLHLDLDYKGKYMVKFVSIL